MKGFCQIKSTFLNIHQALLKFWKTLTMHCTIQVLILITFWLRKFLNFFQGVFFYIYKTFHFRTIPKHLYCQIERVPRPLKMGQLAYGFPKNSPYLPIINFFIKDLRDYGILQRHTYKYLSKRPIQCDTQAETKPIGK